MPQILSNPDSGSREGSSQSAAKGREGTGFIQGTDYSERAASSTVTVAADVAPDARGAVWGTLNHLCQKDCTN